MVTWADVARVGLYWVRTELSKQMPHYFNPRVKEDWITAPHHELIADRLLAVLDGDLDRLIISMPPRNGKSEMASVLFPALYLANNPGHQIIHISYSAALSNEFSRRVRALIRDDMAYRSLFPHVQLDPERQRLDDWKLSDGGGFKSVGVEGGLTGHGAHLMIIDDPVKEGDEQSPTKLQAIYDWYLSAARTRLAPGAAVVVIMTRWHPLDLVGRLLDLARKDENADQWETLVLPALAGDDDLLGRQPGEALWPERFSKRDLEAVKALSGRYFEALYQQNPQISENPMFVESDFARATLTPASSCVWCFDLAITKTSRSDYNVFGRWYLNSERDTLALLDGRRFRAEWPEVKAAILALMDLYPHDIFAFPRHTYELLAVQSLAAESVDYANQIVSVALTGDKVANAQSFSDFVGRGDVFVCDGEFGDSFIFEHVHFPDAAPHDDCVDCSSVATHYYGLPRTIDLLLGWGDE